MDYSQTIISSLMAEIGTRSDVDIDTDLLRHIVVNNIRSYKQKFGREYGELVIACDSKIKYWRKDIFPYYKANRKKLREESPLNWKDIFDNIRIIRDEFVEFFPYKIIDVPSAEADDVVATLAEWSCSNDLLEIGFVTEPKPLLIISGDHDFIQLQKFKHVKQFSPKTKKFVTPERTPGDYVLEHIIKGDKGDGIPNVLSDDDCIVSGVRQKSITSKKLEEWIANPSTMPDTHTFKRNFDRNKKLVDLSYVPEEIKLNIINTFVNHPKKDKSLLLPYFIKNRMKQMIEHIEEF